LHRSISKYIFHLIFEELLQTETELTTDVDAFRAFNGVKLHYGKAALDDELYALGGAKKDVILTPHPGEMARLGGFSSPKDVQSNRLKIAMRFAQREGIVLVLKGHETLVTDAKRLYINTTGNPGMATAGAGDVLTGIIVSLVAQGLSAFEAAQLGVHIHGLAGDIARHRRGEIGMIATDILDRVPRALRLYQTEQAKAGEANSRTRKRKINAKTEKT